MTRHLKIYVAAGVDFRPLTLSLYSSPSGDCGLAEVLAKNSQSQRGDVSKWAGGNPGCDWAIWVCESYGALVQAVGQMCLQPTLPGRLQLREEIEHWLVVHLACESDTTVFGLVFGTWRCDRGEYWGDMWCKAVRILSMSSSKGKTVEWNLSCCSVLFSTVFCSRLGWSTGALPPPVLASKDRGDPSWVTLWK